MNQGNTPSGRSGSEMDRRELLKTFAAVGAGAFFSGSRLSAQGNPRRIDVHHHYQLPGTGGALGFWSPARALEEMDKFGIETTVLSRPGGEAHDGTEKARTFARRSNEYAAKVVSDNRKRFGFFAII